MPLEQKGAYSPHPAPSLKRRREMDEKELACLCLKILFEKGLITLKSGNVSFLSEDGGSFWITPSGKPKPFIRPEDLVEVSLEGEVLKGGKPSIEYRMHLLSYLNKNCRAIVHSHPKYSLILGELGLVERIQEYYEGTLLIGNVGVVEKEPPGSLKLAEMASKCLKEKEVAILKGHGCIARGKDLFEALERTIALEHLSEMILRKEALKKLLRFSLPGMKFFIYYLKDLPSLLPLYPLNRGDLWKAC